MQTIRIHIIHRIILHKPIQINPTSLTYRVPGQPMTQRRDIEPVAVKREPGLLVIGLGGELHRLGDGASPTPELAKGVVVVGGHYLGLVVQQGLDIARAVIQI